MCMQFIVRAGVVLSLLCSRIAFAQTGNSPREQFNAHAAQAQQYLSTNRPDLAVGEFKVMLAIEPGNLSLRNNLGTLLYFQGDFAAAATELRAVVKGAPSLWKTVMLLGMCEKRLGNAPAARSDLEQAFSQLQDEKLRVQAGLELTEVYYASRDLDKAADVLATLRKLKPDDPNILYAAHRIYSEQADETALSLAIAAPQSAWMQELMGQEMAVQGKNDAAIQHYRDALKLDERVPGLHFELAELLSSSSSPEDKQEAEHQYREALRLNPFDEKSECRLGRIALARSDLKEAQTHYARALQLQPQDAEANLGLGRVLLAMNQPQKAQELLEKAVHLDPTDATAHYHLGTLYRQLGKPDDSHRELAEFQKLKHLKEQLKDVYKGLRLQAKTGQDDPETAQ